MGFVNFFKLAAVAACLAGMAAQAQAPAAYDGTWRASFEGNRGAGREGTVVIKDGTGTWDMAVRGTNDPCLGRAAPIAVRTATADELVFNVERSKALAGCRDTVARMKRVDANKLEGVFGGDRKITLVRE